MKTVLVLLSVTLTTSAFAQPTEHQRQAKQAFEFLSKTPITGAESEAMANARAWLGAIANGQLGVSQPAIPAPSPMAQPNRNEQPRE